MVVFVSSHRGWRLIWGQCEALALRVTRGRLKPSANQQAAFETNTLNKSGVRLGGLAERTHEALAAAAALPFLRLSLELSPQGQRRLRADSDFWWGVKESGI